MKTQKEYFGNGSIEKLEEILVSEKPNKIFLVTGKNSYVSSGAQEKIEPILFNYPWIRFSNFLTNPKIEDIERGVELFRKEKCDFVIAIGGGSVIDTAKAINIFSSNLGIPTEYVVNGKELDSSGSPFVAIPTTSGSGSEATHFAVVYVDKVKYSLKNGDCLLPDYCIIDPEFTSSLSLQITAHTGLDALSQAIEGYWSVNSTEEAKRYSEEAIKLVMDNLEIAVNNPTSEARMAMAKASNLAGKSINISKTTACHAISYPFTSYFGIPHGHAVGLTLGEMVVYNGVSEINGLLGTENTEESKNKINNLMKAIGLKTKLSELGIGMEDIELVMKKINPERMKNNPREVTEEVLRRMLVDIL